MEMKLLILSLFVAVCAAYPRGLDEDKAPAFFRSRRGGWLDCKQPNDRCYGFPPCCNDMVCYWENGYSMRTPGKCVECIDRGLVCQRDAQCCQPLVCQKETTYSANGKCDVKLPLGADCHDNDQCETEFCQIHWYNDVVMGHGGKCANPV